MEIPGPTLSYSGSRIVHATFSINSPDSKAPLRSGIASLLDLRVCGQWRGLLVSSSFSVTPDKVVIAKVNHKQKKNTQRPSPLPPATCRNKAAGRENLGPSFFLPYSARLGAPWSQLIELPTNRIGRGSQPELWKDTQPRCLQGSARPPSPPPACVL